MSTGYLKWTWDGLAPTKGNVQSIEDPHLFSVAAQGWVIICLL